MGSHLGFTAGSLNCGARGGGGVGGVLATASVGLGSSATSSSDLGAASAFAGGAAGEGPGSGVRDLDGRLVRGDLEVRLEDFLTFSPAPASGLSLALSIFPELSHSHAV